MCLMQLREHISTAHKNDANRHRNRHNNSEQIDPAITPRAGRSGRSYRLWRCVKHVRSNTNHTGDSWPDKPNENWRRLSVHTRPSSLAERGQSMSQTPTEQGIRTCESWFAFHQRDHNSEQVRIPSLHPDRLLEIALKAIQGNPPILPGSCTCVWKYEAQVTRGDWNSRRASRTVSISAGARSARNSEHDAVDRV